MAGGQRWVERYEGVDWENYDKIFHEVIPNTVLQLDPDRPYWPSSPHHPLDREKTHPDWETGSGNVHTYEVWGGERDFSAFDEMGQYRFVAEFGLQSLPDMETIRSFTAPEDRYFSSRIIDHHEKSGGPYRPGSIIGTTKIAGLVGDLFLAPKDMENWVYVSQLMHAEGMRRGCEAMRRNFPVTTGALYWQIDDNWPVVSGSGMDYFGRWKALQYEAKRFFSPVMVSAEIGDEDVRLFGINDLMEDIDAELEWELGRFDGGGVVRSGRMEVVLPANASTLLTELDFPEIVENPDFITYRKFCYENRSRHYLAYSLVRGDEVLSSNAVFFVKPKYLQLEDPGLRWRMERDGDGPVVSVSADRFAAFVRLGVEHGYARFSDNFFHLPPGRTKAVRVLDSEIDPESLEEALFVKSLVDSYR